MSITELHERALLINRAIKLGKMRLSKGQLTVQCGWSQVQ